MFVDLATAQHLENATGQVNFISVTNTGSQVDGVGLSSTVSAHLNATLARTPGTSGLTVHNLLQDAVAKANAASAGLVTIFLVFGLFSIVAGAMLIVGIFSMIAEERKGEMGMLRAIGLTRRVIVLSYYFEGLIYSVGSALAGTFVGVLSGFILLYAYVHLVPVAGFTPSVLLNSFTYTEASLLTAYLVGFFLTLGTVALASIRVSRLNIVRAIRDVPEPPPPIRTYTFLAYVGGALLLAGLYLFATTYQGTSDASYPVLGARPRHPGRGTHRFPVCEEPARLQSHGRRPRDLERARAPADSRPRDEPLGEHLRYVRPGDHAGGRRPHDRLVQRTEPCLCPREDRFRPLGSHPCHSNRSFVPEPSRWQDQYHSRDLHAGTVHHRPARDLQRYRDRKPEQFPLGPIRGTLSSASPPRQSRTCRARSLRIRTSLRCSRMSFRLWPVKLISRSKVSRRTRSSMAFMRHPRTPRRPRTSIRPISTRFFRPITG